MFVDGRSCPLGATSHICIPSGACGTGQMDPTRNPCGSPLTSGGACATGDAAMATERCAGPMVGTLQILIAKCVGFKCFSNSVPCCEDNLGENHCRSAHVFKPVAASGSQSITRLLRLATLTMHITVQVQKRLVWCSIHIYWRCPKCTYGVATILGVQGYFFPLAAPTLAFFVPRTFFIRFLRSFRCLRPVLPFSPRPFLHNLYLGSNFLAKSRVS